MNKSLFAVFAEDRFPHEAAVQIGGTQKLKVRYRAAPKSQDDAVGAYLLAQIAALGFPDAKVALGFFAAGVMPEGETRTEFESACEALGPECLPRVKAAVALSEGYALSQLVGSWSLLDGKDEFALAEPVTAETCAALPADVQKAIVRLSAGAEAPADALDFFGKPPRF